jgi:hypothetical protein
MPVEDLRKRYISLFESEPTDKDTPARIESRLGVVLPDDFKAIATFYSGGMVGGISHHALEISGPADNIVAETEKLRTAVALPHTMVVLAEPAESLVVLNTSPDPDGAAVIWLDATDVRRLNNVGSLNNPQLWPSYSDFFKFLLEQEQDERTD